MGNLKQVAEIQTERNEYLVEKWIGGGRTTSSEYPKPAKLHKQSEYEGYRMIEEWSACYGKKTSPRKTVSQVVSEAIKKLRFYDNSDIISIKLSSTNIEFSQGDIWIQPNIDSQNRDWEVYKVGSKQISHKGSKGRLQEKVENPTVFSKNGQVLTSGQEESTVSRRESSSQSSR